MAIKLPNDMPYIKTVTAKGKRYEYFDTGKDHRGRKILKRLPPRSDKAAFGSTYAAYLAIRTRRQNVASSPTLKELSREYQLTDKFRKRATSTQDTYLVYIRLLEDLIGDAPINEIKRVDVQELVDQMSDRPGAAKMALLVLRNMWRLAMRKEWATIDPTKHVEVPESDDDADYQPWPEDLLAAALQDEKVGFPVALLYYTGQRIGDVCKMRWDDIQDDDTIHVVQEKTGNEVWPPIHSDLRPWIDESPRTTETMLHGIKGRIMRKATLRTQLQKWAKARGHDIVPHGLRKNAVIALLEAGCSVLQTSAITGQSLTIVELYAKRRNTRRLGKQAMSIWDGTEREDRKREENS